MPGRIAIITGIFITTVGASFGQVADYLETMAPQRGDAPYATYSEGKLGNINMVSGSLSYEIPVATLPKGRGGFSFGLNLTYSSDIYDVTYYTTDQNGSTVAAPRPSVSTWGGWQYTYSYDLQMDTITSATSSCTNDSGQHFIPAYMLSVIFPDGSHHVLSPVGPYAEDSPGGYYMVNPGGYINDSACTGVIPPLGDLTYQTTDGTYARLWIHNSINPTNVWTNSHWTLTFPDGRTVAGVGYHAQRVQDANGNGYTITYSTPSGGMQDCWYVQICSDAVYATTTLSDDVRRTITIDHTTNEYSQPVTDVITAPSFGSNATVSATVNFTTVPSTGTFNNGYSDEWTDTNNLVVVSSLQLPGSQGSSDTTLTWAFGYSAYGGDDFVTPGTSTAPCSSLDSVSNTSSHAGWGELNCMQTPGGALTTFFYQLDGGLRRSFNEMTENPVVNKTVTQASPYMTIDTWTYTHSIWDSLSCNITGLQCTTMTAPDGGITQTNYVDARLPLLLRGRVLRTIFPDGSKQDTSWGLHAGVPDFGNPWPQTVAHYEPSGNYVSAHSSILDVNGNETDSFDYDLINTLPSPFSYDSSGMLQAYTGAAGLLRHKVSTYVVKTADGQEAPSDSNAGHLYSDWGGPVRYDLLHHSYVSGTGGSELGGAVAFGYDGAGNPLNEWHLKDGNALSGFLQTPTTSNALQTQRTWCQNTVCQGNLNTLTDPAGIVTAYTYDSANLYPTQVTFGGGARTFSLHYEENSGLLQSVTDNDNNIEDIYGYDKVGRLTAAIDAGIRRTMYSYYDTTEQVVTTRDRDQMYDGILRSEITFDPLGRAYLTRQLECAGQSATDDTLGIKQEHRFLRTSSNRYELVSIPYRGSDSSCSEPADQSRGWTMTTYDNMNRPVEIATYDGSAMPTPGLATGRTGRTTMSYSDQSTTTTDPAGVSRVTTADGVGRMTRVVESGISQTTNYGYDPADNLVTVDSAGATALCNGYGGNHTRAFQYDPLGHLTSSCNPETGPALPWTHGATDGIISWTYDSAGRLRTRTEGAGTTGGGTATVTFAYNDPLGQLTSKTYSDSVTPPVTFNYNYAACGATRSCGRLSGVTSTLGGQAVVTRAILGYDEFGNIMGVQQQIGSGTPHRITHSRNLTGALTETVLLPLPASSRIDYGYDEAGRVLSVTGTQNNSQTTYASNLQYSPHGAIESMHLGPVLTESTVYNSNLQPVSMEAKTNPASLLKLAYTYCSTIGTGGVCSSGDDNGNVKTQTITRSGQTWNQSYWYDLVNRLTVARESGPNSSSWEQTFGYDSAGNRWLAANASGDPSRPYSPSNETPQSSSWYQKGSQSNNQITQSGWSYDNGGNILGVGGTSRAFTYDAENRQITATVNGIEEDYTYDGEGRRVMKQDHTTHAATVYVYDADGQLAVEYPAMPPTTGGTQFLTADALGSTRLVTDVSGNVVQCNDYLPFGEDLTAGGRTCVNTVDAVPEKKFTGKERDAESGLDYFLTRYMSGPQGRFTSPDSYDIVQEMRKGKDEAEQRQILNNYLSNPQEWNKFAYALNNPLKNIDPDGRNACGTNDDSTCKVTVTIQDRAKDKSGNYNDQFAGTKGNAAYNGTATVSVNGQIKGVYLVSTVPSGPGLATVQNGTYSGTFVPNHDGQPAIALSGGGPVPVVGGLDPATGTSYATGILVHIAGLPTDVSPLGGTGMTRAGKPISAGCQLICSRDYGSFANQTGLRPTDGSPPQRHFSVTIKTTENR